MASFPLIIFLIAMGRGTHSYNWEMALVLSISLFYFFEISSQNGETKNLVVFAVISGAAVAAAMALVSYIFFPDSEMVVALRNSNILALHLAVALPFSCHSVVLSRGRMEKIFYLVLAGIMISALIRTGSLGNLWALGFGYLLISSTLQSGQGSFSLRHSETALPIPGALKKWRHGFWPWAGVYKTRVFIALAILLTVFIAAQKFYFSPSSLLNRWEWARAAFYIFLDHWIIGAAREGGFMSLYPLYKGLGPLQEGTIFVHNFYLELISNGGICGFLFTILALWAWVQYLKRPVFFPLKITFLIVFFTGFWDSSILVFPNFLAFLGLTASQISPNSSVRFQRIYKKAAFCASLAGVTLGLYLAACAFQMFMARSYLISSSFWINASVHNIGALKKSKELLAQSLRWDPLNPDAWSDLARLEYRRDGVGRSDLFLSRAQWAAWMAHSADKGRKMHLYNLKVLYSRY